MKVPKLNHLFCLVSIHNPENDNRTRNRHDSVKEGYMMRQPGRERTRVVKKNRATFVGSSDTLTPNT